jgi:pSer/pThr/pTyr-binding forkhead associated (FHA) protein
MTAQAAQVGEKLRIQWPWGEQIVSSPLLIGREPPAPAELIRELIARGLDNVSRRHAELELVAGKPCITDLGSSNGTFVNGIQMKPKTRQQLQERAVIRFGADLEIAVSTVGTTCEHEVN